MFGIYSSQKKSLRKIFFSEELSHFVNFSSSFHHFTKKMLKENFSFRERNFQREEIGKMLWSPNVVWVEQRSNQNIEENFSFHFFRFNFRKRKRISFFCVVNKNKKVKRRRGKSVINYPASSQLSYIVRVYVISGISRF